MRKNIGEMEDLIQFAFRNLLTRINELSIDVPRNEDDLSQSCLVLENIFEEYRELTRFVHMALSLNED